MQQNTHCKMYVPILDDFNHKHTKTFQNRMEDVINAVPSYFKRSVFCCFCCAIFGLYVRRSRTNRPCPVLLLSRIVVLFCTCILVHTFAVVCWQMRAKSVHWLSLKTVIMCACPLPPYVEWHACRFSKAEQLNYGTIWCSRLACSVTISISKEIIQPAQEVIVRRESLNTRSLWSRFCPVF